jgi:hypothetical protein
LRWGSDSEGTVESAEVPASVFVIAESLAASIFVDAGTGGNAVLFRHFDMDGVADSKGHSIKDNGVGPFSRFMEKTGGHFKYNLDLRNLGQTGQFYLLPLTVTDHSTGELRSEMIPLQNKWPACLLVRTRSEMVLPFLLSPILMPTALLVTCWLLRWPETDLNRRHEDLQSTALPTELSGLILPRFEEDPEPGGHFL